MAFYDALLPRRMKKDLTIIPVVRLQGTIMTGGSQFRPALNLASVAGSLDKAFSMKRSPAVAIIVNSPGGSPVQSRLIFKRIRDLAEEKQKQEAEAAEKAKKETPKGSKLALPKRSIIIPD